MMMMVIEWRRDDEVNIIIYKDCDPTPTDEALCGKINFEL